jgi:hypothetical protein
MNLRQRRHSPREFVEVGFEPRYCGPAGFREYMSTWSEVFGPDLRVEPVELIEAGDRIVLLADLQARADRPAASPSRKPSRQSPS